jgi:Flp pilus assembly protein TadG
MTCNARLRTYVNSLLRDKAGADGGSTLIEVAVCLPLSFTMTFGFIYFSLMILGLCNYAFAGRAVTRYASIHSNTSSLPTTQTAMNAIIARYVVPYPTNTCTVTYSYGNGNNIGQPVYINVVAIYHLSIMGISYGPITFSWSTVGGVVE